MPRAVKKWANALASAVLAVAIAVAASCPGHALDLGGAGEGVGGLLGEGLDFKGGMLDWEEDDAGRRVAILRNYAVIILPNLTISARNMVLNVELQEVYAEGDVVFEEKDGNSFMCDQLTFNYQEWKGLAKNIRLRAKISSGEAPVRDFLDDEPSISMSHGQSLNNAIGSPIRRMYVSADELRAHDQDTFELINAKTTPDAFAKPHWHFETPAALLRRDEKIEAYHNTVKIGRLPVLYFPYLIRDLQYDWPWMRAEAGHNSDFGVYARTQWAWRLRDNPGALFQMTKIIFDVDWFSRRGAGLGIETTYKVGGWEDSLGKLKIYGVYEYAISKGRDRKRAFEDNDDKIYFDHFDNGLARVEPDALGNNHPFNPSLYRKDFRWAVDWEHTQRFNELWDMRAAVHLYHDRDYLREYDSANYWNEVDRKNMFSLRRLDKDWVFELAAEARLSNKWMEGAQYYPELRAAIPGMQLGDLPLFLKNDLRVGLVDYVFDEDEVRYTRWRNDGLWERDPETNLSTSRLWNGDHYGSFFRAFNEISLEAPLKLFDAVTVKPWVGLRTAYYEDTLGKPLDAAAIGMLPGTSDYYNAMVFTRDQMRRKGGSDTYHAVPFGVDIASRFYTIFGASDQWRFISEPTLAYLENTKPSHDSRRELYIVDEHDVYFRQRKLGFDFHGTLQRRNYGDAPGADVPHRDVLDFSLAFNYYPRRDDRLRFNAGESVSDIEFDMTWRPMDRLSLEMGLMYDPAEGRLKRGLFRAGWQFSNLMRFTAAHYHYSEDYWYTGGFMPYTPKVEWEPDNPGQPGLGVHPVLERLDPSDQTVLAVRTKLWNDSSHYSLEAAATYEWRDSSGDWRRERTGVRHGLNKYRVTLYRDVDTFEMSLSYVRNRYKNDHGVYFSISPKSFMGFDRPPPTYSGAVAEMEQGRYSDAEYYYATEYRIDAPVSDADLKDVQF
ncbi:MAG: hypothetical protein LBJ46_08460 [Planctomycetota bacterium]|jgi:polyisoprenoid-binding protein YceI|nr:hypothetical protein [Planctomycetota bacterium]